MFCTSAYDTLSCTGKNNHFSGWGQGELQAGFELCCWGLEAFPFSGIVLEHSHVTHQGQHGSSGARSYQERKISCWHVISVEKS